MRHAASTPAVVDQIPDSSRPSVARSPLSEAGAGWPAAGPADQVREGLPALAQVHPPRQVGDPAALEGRGVEQRGEQGPGSLGPVVGAPTPCARRRDASTIASAVCTAASQFAAPSMGDQPTRVTPGGHDVVPLGSKRCTCPTRDRCEVATSTSSFVDVVTTAPRASSTFGTSSELVFPERVGPSTSVLRRAPLNTLVVPVRPR